MHDGSFCENNAGWEALQSERSVRRGPGEYLFVPAVKPEGTFVQVISADDRLLLAEQAITRDGAPFRTLPCLAVNPLNKYLYVFEENIGEEFAENSSPIVVYSVDFEEIARGGNDFLAEHAVVSVYFEDGEDLGSLGYRDVRGACFDEAGHLILSAFSEMKEGAEEADTHGVIAVLEMPDYLVKGKSYLAGRTRRYTAEEMGLAENEEPGEIFFEGGELRVEVRCQGETVRYVQLRMEVPEAEGLRCAFLITVTNGERIERGPGDESFAAECGRRRESRRAVRNALERWGITCEEFENRPFLEMRRRIDEICAEAGKESEIFFYIGCHGNTGGLWLDYDAEGTHKVGWEELQGFFGSVPGRKVVFLDACHSGSGVERSEIPATAARRTLRRAAVEPEREVIPDREAAARMLDEDLAAFVGMLTGRLGGRMSRLPRKLEKLQHPDNFVICSCSMEERSWNYEGHSLFSEWLARGLGAGGELPADRDLDEMLTLKKLYEYVKENVARISEEKNLEWAATGASYLQTVQCYPPADGAFAEEVILE